MNVTKRKTEEKENKGDSSEKETEIDEKKVEKDKAKDEVVPKYGFLPRFSGQRTWSRAVVIFGVLLYVWYSSRHGRVVNLAKQNEMISNKGQDIPCDPEYLKEIKHFPGCVPKTCGRFVSDKIVSIHEAEILSNVAKRGIALGTTDGGASILDLHSGAVNYGDKFINVYSLEGAQKFITPADLAVYKIIKNKIRHAIAENFAIDSQSLYLTHPTFFSKLTNVEAKTPHDEYWHIHVDKDTYESFHYTSLLYLTDYSKDFKGGRFSFVNNMEKPTKNITVEPRKGRVLMFTSGAENPHFVEPVTSGVRYAITVSFTCDKSKAISDPAPKL